MSSLIRVTNSASTPKVVATFKPSDFVNAVAASSTEYVNGISTILYSVQLSMIGAYNATNNSNGTVVINIPCSSKADQAAILDSIYTNLNTFYGSSGSTYFIQGKNNATRTVVVFKPIDFFSADYENSSPDSVGVVKITSSGSIAASNNTNGATKLIVPLDSAGQTFTASGITALTTNGSKSLQASSTTNLAPGMSVIGANIPYGTLISSIGSLGTFSGTTSSSVNPKIVYGTTTGVNIDDPISCALLPVGTTVLSIPTVSTAQAITYNTATVISFLSQQGFVGATVSGTGIPSSTTISSLVVPKTITGTTSTTSSTSTITGVSSTDGLLVGSLITGTGIAPNAIITAIPSSSTITMSIAATQSVANTTIVCGTNSVVLSNAATATSLNGTTITIGAGMLYVSQAANTTGTQTITYGGNIILSAACTNSASGVALTISGNLLPATTTANSNSVLVPSTSDMVAGMLVVGQNIPPNSFVTSIVDSTHFTMTYPAQVSGLATITVSDNGLTDASVLIANINTNLETYYSQ